MLAFTRRMNPHLTKASTTTNTVGSTDEHIPSGVNPEKLLLINGNLSQEPTTPSPYILNTPNTCTKNATFFYEMPTTMPTATLPGKLNENFLFFISFIKLKICFQLF